MSLAEACYRVTQAFPREELFSLTAQIRRAASSVPANIAEGYGRGTRNEYMHFLRVAQGSLKELETHLLLSERIGLAPSHQIEPLLTCAERTGKMLRLLLRALAQPRVPHSPLPTPHSLSEGDLNA